jgi:hypothetical protein
MRGIETSPLLPKAHFAVEKLLQNYLALEYRRHFALGWNFGESQLQWIDSAITERRPLNRLHNRRNILGVAWAGGFYG